MAADLEQDSWKTELKKRFPQFFNNVKVLDVGSANINGSNKPWFEDCQYIGLDIAEYKDVDVVSIAHRYNEPDGSFDVVLSTNQLEHDIYWEKTLEKMINLVRHGGLMFFQTTHDRPEHGTKTKNPEDSLTVNFGDEEWANFYKRFTIGELKEFLKPDEIFEKYEISYQPPSDLRDIYFWGIKR